MQRPTACRRAVHSLAPPSPSPYIWISDDVLSQALHRFLRPVHHKRHGSSVPGPLEARRRAAKRRMTAAAYANGGAPPPPFSFGALFGLQTAAPQPAFRYQPPTRVAPQPLEHTWGGPPPAPELCTEEMSPAHNAARTAPSTSPLLRSAPAPTEAPLPPDKSPKDVPPICVAQKSTLRSPGGNRQREAVSDLEQQDPLTLFKKAMIPVESMREKKRPTKHALVHVFKRYCPKTNACGDFVEGALLHLINTGWRPMTLLAHFEELQLPQLNLFGPRSRIDTPGTLQLLKAFQRIIENPAHLQKLYLNFVLSPAARSKAAEAPKDAVMCLVHRKLWEHCVRGSTAAELEVLRRLVFKSNYVQENLAIILSAPSSAATRLTELLATQPSQKHVNGIARIVSACPGEMVWHCIDSITMALHEMGRGGVSKSSRQKLQASSRATGKQKLLGTWLTVLRTADAERASLGVPSDYSVRAYRALATAGAPHNFPDISRSLSALPPMDLIMAFLPWLPRLTSISSHHDKVEKLRRELQSLYARQHGKITLGDAVAETLSLMHQLSIPNHEAAEVLFGWMYEYKGPSAVLDILRSLEAKGAKLSDTTFLERLQQKILEGPDHKLQASAIEHARAVSKLDIGHTATVQEQNTRIDALQPRYKFKTILDFAGTASHLPPALRTMGIDELLSHRAQIIHHIAHQYSLDHTISARQAWRNIFYLHRYLRDHSLPISPLFLNAAIEAGITRPLSERRFVSSRKAAYLYYIVRDVEGEVAAIRLEKNFRWMRGELIFHAKRILHECGGSGKAHVNTMRRLGML